MKILFAKISSLLLCFTLVTGSAIAQEKITAAAKAGHITKAPSGMQWLETPESWQWPEGTKIAYLEGDPVKKGFYTVRLMLPSDYKVMPQWAVSADHVTVIEGDLMMGHGDDFMKGEEAEMPVGSFSLIPMKVKYYMYTKDRPAIIQMHGMGPRKIVYTDPANDPKKKTSRR